MAELQLIDTGATSNDGTGDPLPVGGSKINGNFQALWGPVFTDLPAAVVAVNNNTAAIAGETQARIADVNLVRAGGINNGSLTWLVLSTQRDSDKIRIVNLAEEVVSSLAGGLDPEDYLGEIVATNQAIAAAASANGKWYSITVTGTLSGTNAPAIAVSQGDRLLSNGVAWTRYAAAPTSVPDGSIGTAKLAAGAVTSTILAPDAVKIPNLADEVETAIAKEYIGSPGAAAAGFATDTGKLALGVDDDGRLMFDGQRYKSEELGKDWPLATTDFAWGFATPLSTRHKLVLAVKQDGTVYGPFGKLGGDSLLAVSGAGYTTVQPADEITDVTETPDGTAFRFFAKPGALWLPYRAGKSGNGYRARYRPADLNHILLYGQSNATRAGNEPTSNNALTITPNARHLMPKSYVAGTTSDPGLMAPQNATDATAYRALPFTGFQALFEGRGVADDGETMASGLVQTLGTRLGWKFLASSAAVGGYSITQLVKGQYPYADLMYQVSESKRLSDLQGTSYKVAAIAYIQGEQDSGDSTWDTKLKALVDDLNTDIRAITGQAEDVVVIIEQMNRPVWSTPMPVDLAILRAHHGSGGRIYWHNPRYHITMDAHYYPHGKRWRGCHIGETLAKILGGDHEWEGLTLQSSSVSGSSLFLRFNVPVAPLVFATSQHVPSLLSLYGFEATGLTAVQLAADTVVQLTNSGAWTGLTLKYARQTGLDSQKGNLGDSDPAVAVYNDAAAAPYPLRNWCAAFEITL